VKPRGPVSRAARRAGLSALGVYTAYVIHGLRHPALLRAAVTSADRRASLPGDEIVRDPDWVTNFAIDIAASPDEVWPWLVQMGFGRAGYYTWFPLDNGGVPSAEAIVPSLQGLAVGDIVPDGPRAAEGFGVWRVCVLDRPRAIVLHSRRNLVTGHEVPTGGDGRESYVNCSWVFSPIETATGHTRLRVRVRARSVGKPWMRPALRAARLLFGFGDNVMENTMLAGIRERVEQRRTRA